jgi:phenylacetate-CoA ligase
MRRMEKITGRTDDMMIIRGVNLFPTQFEELILAEPELSAHFQCVLTRPDRLDELTLRVESRTRLGDGDAASVAGRVAERVKATTGATVAVEVLAPGSVERSAGKMRRVVDLR